MLGDRRLRRGFGLSLGGRSRVLVHLDGKRLRCVGAGLGHRRNSNVFRGGDFLLAALPGAAHRGVLDIAHNTRIVDRLHRSAGGALLHLRLHAENSLLNRRLHRRRVGVRGRRISDLHPLVGEVCDGGWAVSALACLRRGRLPTRCSACKAAEKHACSGTFQRRVDGAAGVVRLVEAVLAGIGGLCRKVTADCLHSVGSAAFQRTERATAYCARLASAKHCWAALEATSDTGGGTDGTGSRTEHEVDGRSHAHALVVELAARFGLVIDRAKARIEGHLLLEFFVRELVRLFVDFLLDQACVDRAAGRGSGQRCADGFGHDAAGDQRSRDHGGHVRQLERRCATGMVPEVFARDAG